MSYIATLTSKGQITIPKNIRTLLNLRKQQKLVFTPSQGKVIIEPVDVDLDALCGSIAHIGGPLNFDQLEKGVASLVAHKYK